MHDNPFDQLKLGQKLTDVWGPPQSVDSDGWRWVFVVYGLTIFRMMVIKVEIL
jgi:hypothetical protein